MALIWFDGFESYDLYYDIIAVSSDLIASITRSGSPYCTEGYSRRSGYRGLRMIGISDSLHWNFANDYSTLIVGVACELAEADTPTYYSSNWAFRFRDDTTTQIQFHVVGSEIQVRKPDETLLGTTSGAGLTYGAWRYIEIKVTFHETNGAVTIRCNGREILALTSIDTQASANASANSFGMAGWSGGSYLDTYFDDMYILDTSGSKNNDFLGDVRVDVLRPSGAGTYSQFTPLSGANYENVDETYPDDDTSYNETDVNGEKDSYAMGDLDATGKTIHGVKNQVTAKKTDAGSRNLQILTRSGGSDYLTDTFALSDTYTTIGKVYEDNPDDSSAWEEADVNGMEVGMLMGYTTTTTTT